MNVEAHLTGGPGNGRIMAIDGIRQEIVIQHMERPISWASYIADADGYSYRPVKAVVYYEPYAVERYP